MERKEAIRYISLLLGGTLVGSGSFLSGCKNVDDKKLFSSDDITLLDDIAETILPETNTPGAKAAKVGEFMTVMVTDCYNEKQQETFHNGMKKINELSEQQFDVPFVKITPKQKQILLVQLDKEQKQFMKSKKEDEPSHYFRMMKELTLLGYFTSEPGCTKAKRYIPVPGKYIGCVPYKKGDKTFA